MTPTDAVVRYFCPALGNVVAIVLFLSPMPAVLEVRRTRDIGETNALPFAALGTNALSWLFYGFLTRDFFVFVPNWISLMLSWWYLFICYRYSKEAAQDILMWYVLGTAALFFAVGSVQVAREVTFATAKTLWGSAAVAVLCLYYVSPLTTVAKVLRERDSASLNGPLCAMNVVNGILWGVYGLATGDFFIGVPNSAGAVFNVACVVLCFIFPKRRSPRAALLGIPAAAADPAPALRLQSAHPIAGKQGARPGGFFDVSLLRWRSGKGLGAAAPGIGAGAAVEVAVAGGGEGEGAGLADDPKQPVGAAAKAPAVTAEAASDGGPADAEEGRGPV